jgi:di/tricarboxylate transporter
MLKQDGTPDKRFKENKGGGFLDALMSLVYILIIGILLYVGWSGIIKLFTGKDSDANDELAMKLAGIHSLALIGIFIAGVCTEGETQDWFIEATAYGIAWSIILIIVGLLCFALIDNKE